MGDGWCPFAEIDVGEGAGAYTDNGEPKGLLHTTESKSYASAWNSYLLNRSWPHMTCTYESSVFRAIQHNNIFVASRSLRNLPGGVETNKDRIFQVELVGSADTAKRDWGPQYVETFPRAYLDGIGKVMRWAEQELGIPKTCTVTFKTYPSSFGDNGVRLSGPAFDAYSGWLGHQHAPENTHGDPGLIDIAYLLSVGSPTIPFPEEEDDMPYLHASKFTGVSFVDASGATWLSSPSTVDELVRQGVKVLRMDGNENDVRRIISDRAANTDELILASESRQEAILLTIAALPEVPVSDPVVQPPPE